MKLPWYIKLLKTEYKDGQLINTYSFSRIWIYWQVFLKITHIK